MKIKPEHYEHMKAAIAKLDIDEHRQRIIAEGKAQDVEKRVRWDISYHAGLTNWICDNIYSYANDVHLDTALRSIVKELTA